MYKRIVLAVDLAEPTPIPKGLTQAVELAKTGGGELRLVNVQPVMPATFMEYVPVDFDVEQAKRAKEALDAILGSIDLPAERKSAATRAGGIYHELLEEASEWDADLIVVGSHRPVMSDYLLARTPRRSCAMRNVRCWWSGNDAASRSQSSSVRRRAPASPLRPRRGSADTCDAERFRRSSKSTANDSRRSAASD